MEHELPGVLDGVDEPVTVEELEGVVRRAGQRRRARLVAGAAALLVLGALGGALARGPADEGPRGFAGGPQEEKPPPAAAMGKSAFDAAGPLTFTPLFRREANGVAVRAYQVSTPEASQPPDGACRIPPRFVQVELSNDAAVGTGIGPLLPMRGAIVYLTPNDSLRVAGAGSFGIGEGVPVTWAVVDMAGNAAQLRLRVGSATDSMAPIDGRAALVVPGAGGDGVVEALDAGGAVIATQPLKQEPKIDPGCPAADCKVLERGGGAVGPAGQPGQVAPTPPPGDPTEKAPKRWTTVEPDPNGGPDHVTEHVCGMAGLDGPPMSAPGTSSPDPGPTTIVPGGPTTTTAQPGTTATTQAP